VRVAFRWSVHISKYGNNGNEIAETIGMMLTVEDDDVVVYSGQGVLPNMEIVAMQINNNNKIG
jgi:hypothetical protein